MAINSTLNCACWGTHGPCLPLGVEGTFRTPPPAICETIGPIPDPKTPFDSPWHELSEYNAVFYPKVIDDDTGQLKGQFLTVIAGFAGQSRTPRA